MKDPRVTIGPIGFEHPIVNAAGTCKRTEDVERLARSAVSAVIVGSITKEPRPGNGGNVWAVTDHSSINSLGLPNGGLSYYKRELPEMIKLVRAGNKAIIVSVAGFSPQESAELVRFCMENMVDGIEINLGCPNVWSGGEQKEIASYHPDIVQETLAAVDEATFGNDDGSIVYGYKLSPLEPSLLGKVAALVNMYPVSFVTTSNTFPNCFGFQEGERMLIDSDDVPEGFGGGAGPGFRLIGQGQVKQLRKHLRSEIKVNGAGGVTCGQHVHDYQRSGADGLVQIASHYLASSERPAVFGDILTEFSLI